MSDRPTSMKAVAVAGALCLVLAAPMLSACSGDGNSNKPNNNGMLLSNGSETSEQVSFTAEGVDVLYTPETIKMMGHEDASELILDTSADPTDESGYAATDVNDDGSLTVTYTQAQYLYHIEKLARQIADAVDRLSCYEGCSVPVSNDYDEIYV